MKVLPAGFEDLEPFVEIWDLPTSQDRWARRQGMAYAEVVRFYDAMWPHLEAATAHVEHYPLHDMPEDAARLFRLILAMMHVAVGVEIFGASRVPFAPWPHELKIVSGFQPYG
jgi:hypothetical protein